MTEIRRRQTNIERRTKFKLFSLPPAIARHSIRQKAQHTWQWRAGVLNIREFVFRICFAFRVSDLVHLSGKLFRLHS
jgi:hypothetical protein